MYIELDNLTDLDIPLIEYMKAFALQTVFEPYDLMGFHAVPSQRLLHMHVLGDDLDGDFMVTQGKMNSFTTPYFMHPDLIVRLLRKDKKLSIDKNVMSGYLGTKEERDKVIKNNVNQLEQQEDNHMYNVLNPTVEIIILFHQHIQIFVK